MSMQTLNTCSSYIPGEVCNALYVLPSLKAQLRATVRPRAAAYSKYELNPFTYRGRPSKTQILPLV